MAKVISYVVRQGDYLLRIAARTGVPADEIWGYEKNSELRKKRGEGNVLLPGDLLFIPERKSRAPQLASGASNSYSALVPKIKVKVILSFDGHPLADEPYSLLELPDEGEKVTGADGTIELKVPVTLAETTVVLVRRGQRLLLRIGHLDPAAEPSGARQRLQNLGYLARDVASNTSVEALVDALSRFQRAESLTVTAEVDEATAAALVRKHGA